MKFKKLTTLALTVCISMLLTSCATEILGKQLIHKTAKYATQTLVSDTLIAIGKPSQKVQGYEDSLVLVGNQHSYFIEPISYNKQLFNNIFSKVDLNSVYITTKNINAKIASSCSHKHGCGTVEILFIKEKSKLNINEKEMVKEHGFSCQEKMKGKTNYLTCNNTVSVGFTVISQVKNLDSLQHTFKKPVNLHITKKDMVGITATERNVRHGLYYAIIPVTAVIDVVTFPIQLAVSIAMIGGSDWN